MNERPPLLFTVFVEVEPTRTAEFNAWYNDVHVPEVMDCPGFLTSIRYEEQGVDGKFMAMYQLEGQGALETEHFSKARGWKEMKPVVKTSSSAVWEHIFTAPPGRGSQAENKPNLLRFNRSSVEESHDSEFNAWYNNEHLSELLDCPGWLSASRYKALSGDYQYLATYDLSGQHAFETSDYLRARGFKSVETHVTAASTLTYKPIFKFNN